jgi:hypothetical protein
LKYCPDLTVEAAPNFLEVFNMSAATARQGDLVQLEQSDMRLALTMAKIVKGEFSRAAIEDILQPIKKPHAEVQEEMMWRVEFPGQNKVQSVMEAHLAMVCRNQTDGCLPSQNATANNSQPPCRCKGKGPHPTRQVPPWTNLPPMPSDDNESSEPEGMPPTYVYIHTLLPNTRILPRISCTISILFQIG